MEIAEKIFKKGFTGKITFNRKLSQFTTYAIGGPAQVVAEPSSIEDVKSLIEVVVETNTPAYVIGGGSKILAPDEGVEGIVMVVGELMSGVEEREGGLTVRAGTKNSYLAEKCASLGLAGLEWICDIPGRIGGSIVQNAGMNDKTISLNISTVNYLRSDGNLKTSSAEELCFGYRTSKFKEWRDCVIVSAELKFEEKDEPSKVFQRMNEIKQLRKSKFPLEFPSCGSIFKRSDAGFPGKLIEECGLGGLRIGNAMVSAKHHNFIVNIGDARASDVKKLIEIVSDTVYEKKGVRLEREIIYLEEIRFLY